MQARGKKKGFASRRAPPGRRKRRNEAPEAREPGEDLALLKRLARERLARDRAWQEEGDDVTLFPLPTSGPAEPGTRCLAELQDLEEQFAAGDLTWPEYSQRLRDLAPPDSD